MEIQSILNWTPDPLCHFFVVSDGGRKADDSEV